MTGLPASSLALDLDAFARAHAYAYPPHTGVVAAHAQGFRLPLRAHPATPAPCTHTPAHGLAIIACANAHAKPTHAEHAHDVTHHREHRSSSLQGSALQEGVMHDVLIGICTHAMGYMLYLLMMLLATFLIAGASWMLLELSLAIVAATLAVFVVHPTSVVTRYIDDVTLCFAHGTCTNTYVHIYRYAARIALPMIYIFIHAVRGMHAMLRSPFVLKIAMLGTVLMYFPLAEAVGRETPKLTFTEYFLPGVTRWDSIPFHDFRRVWWVALCAALGNISQEGWSLLQTARNQDLGAPGNPGTPGQQVQSENRNQRLFGAILNYIEANTWLYHYVSSTFQNNGRGLFEYLWVYGHLPYTVDQIDMMEHEWTDATMHRVGIGA